MSLFVDYDKVSGSGLFIRAIAGENLGDRKLVYLDASGTWSLADVDAAATMSVVGLTMDVIASGTMGWILIKGFIGLSTWTWTAGGALYATSTPGELSQTAPALIRQTIGRATSTTQIYFNPQIPETGSAMGCAILEGATAYAGFDECKEPFTNYFLCDGVADNVQIQAAIDYVGALGGGSIHISEGTYTVAATINILYDNIRLFGTGWETILLAAVGATRVILIGDGATALSGIVVENLQIDGDDQNLRGIMLEGAALTLITDSRISGCWIHNTGTAFPVYLRYADRTFVVNNRISDFNRHGISLSSAGYNLIMGNMVEDGTEGFGGIHLSYGSHNIISNNEVNRTGIGIYLTYSDDNLIEANHVHDQTVAHCFELFANCDNNIIIGNSFREPADNYSTVWMDENNLDNIILGNNIQGSSRYGIEIVPATTERTIIRINVIRDNAMGCILDNGTDTKMATKTFQFIQGTTLISAAGNPWGWEIDADTEFALALGQLPLEVQQVVRIKIWAVGLVSPGVSPGYMRAQFTGEAGASDEPYTTEPIDVVDKNCEEDNFAANDVIHWVLDATDDADIGDLLGGDSIQFKVLHEGGAGDDIETDAIFRCVEVEYV